MTTEQAAPGEQDAPAGFGARLKRHRVERGLSREDLAERAGLSVDAISSLERGRRQAPYRDTVALLGRALGLAASEQAALEASVDRRRAPLPTRPDSPGQASPTHLPRHNLPAQTTTLIGREQEVKHAAALLQRDPQAGAPVRLLTLTGAGGVGKSRLAIEIARALLEDAAVFVDGARLVELAPLTDPTLVATTVVATLGLRETPGRSVLENLTEYLRDKQLLLVLDNCEHLVEACAALAGALLRACPQLRLLATSREGLAIPEETLHRVPSLAFPDPNHLPPVEELPAYAAVELFLQRARARREEFVLAEHNARAVAQVCARLDGIPLAIELAAARLSALPVEVLAARLDDCFRLLTGGSRTALPRQRTLRATLDWSYALLTPSEQVLLRRLSVFAGGWTLEAAETICSDDCLRSTAVAELPGEPNPRVAADQVLDLLGGLVDKSLVVLEPWSSLERAAPLAEARYRLLEMVRQYGQEQLDAAGETGSVRERHLAWYLALAEEGAVGLKGPEQLAWLRRLDVEHDNCRAALAWSTLGGTTVPEAQALRPDKAAGLRLAGALFWFWDVRGHLREGLRWLETALAVGDTADSSARAGALIGVGRALAVQGDRMRAWAVLEESLALYRALGDKAGIAQALYYLGSTAPNELTAPTLGELPQAQKLFEESLALCRELQDGWTSARIVRQLSGRARLQAELSHRDYRRAIALGEESVRLARAVGQPSLIAYSLRELGEILYDHGDAGHAGPVLEESLGLARTVGDIGAVCGALKCMAQLARVHGDAARGRACAEELLLLARATGSVHDLRMAFWELGSLAIERGDVERAVALATEGMALERRALPLADRGSVADSLMVLAIAAVALGQPIRAVQLFGANAAIEEPVGGPGPVRAPSAEVCEEALARVRLALDENAFAAAWEQGKALTLEEAIALALSDGGITDVPAIGNVRG